MPTVTKTQLTPRQAARQRGYSVVQKEDGSGWYVRVAYLDADGQRRSACKKHPTEAAAHKWAQATKTAIDAGEHLRKRPDSFDTLADQWVALKADQGVRPVTVEGYRSALAPARAAFGAKPVQQITPAMIRSLMSKLKGRGRATNRQCLTSVKSCFELAIDDGLLKANPAAKVKVTGRQPVEMRVLLAADAARIAAHIKGKRLEACWTLTLAGLRRSEVLGLCWRHIDLDAGTVTIEQARVDLGPGTAEPTPPKSDRGRRTLPLPPEMTAAIRRTRAIRQQEHLKWGVPWSEDCYVAVNEALDPMSGQNYSDAWGFLMKAAGCEQPVNLHAARHGSVTRMMDAKKPVHQVAAWHGHDPAMTLSRYSHDDEDGLRDAGGVLAMAWGS